MSSVRKAFLYISLLLALLAVTIKGQTVLKVTGANFIQSVHIDNRGLSDLPNGGEWGETDAMNIDTYTRLVAIAATNRLGGCSGIMAATFNSTLGFEFVTDRLWKCSNNPEPGWEFLGFDDSDWPAAHEVGRNGDIVSGCSWTILPEMPTTAFWIWTRDFFEGDEVVGCRGFTEVCDTMPCQNGGSCQINSEDLCKCPVRFSGRFCEIPTNECDSNPCQNGGSCELSEEGYTCDCTINYTGTNCETDVSACASSPCQNGATCVFEGDDGYHCICAPGFSGLDCETNINECASAPCLNGATCVDGIAGVTCQCLPGYSGTFCQIDINECLSDPCMNAATCVDRVNGFQCSCHAGYTGTLCETGVGGCETNPCQNGGTCTLDGDGEVECICEPGWLDPLCSTNENECHSNPCQNGATCVDGDGQFECKCTSIFQGPTCTEVVPNCGTIMRNSSVPPINDFWVLCQIDVVNDEPHLNTRCRDLITGINYYNDSSTILAMGGNFGCYPTRYPDEVTGACYDNYNQDKTLAECISCTLMGVCIRVP